VPESKVSATETVALGDTDDVEQPAVDGNRPPEEAPAPVPRARTSRVVVRRIDPWSVFKLSLLFYLCVCLILLVAGALLWAGAAAAGVIGNIEGFIEDIGFDDFRFLPGQILRASALGGLVLVVAGTITNMLLTVLFNLISDVVGGIRMTLAEDVVVRRKR
jgi:hypothetical protein